MSVQAVNSVDAQQPKKSNATGAAVAGGLTLGAAGGLTGYFTAKRPNLEKVFAMEPDTFTTATQNAEGEVKDAATKIGAEINKLQKGEYIVSGEAKTKFDAEVAGQTLADDNEAVTAKKTAQENYDKALLDKANEGKEEAAKYKKLEDVPADAKNTAKEAIKDGDQAKALKDAEANILKAKEAKFREAAKAEGAAQNLKDIVSNYDEAVSKAAEKKSNKITELVGQDDMKSAYGKIKKLFPKEGQWKRAGIWGGIAAAAGVIAGLVLAGGKKAEAPAEAPKA